MAIEIDKRTMKMSLIIGDTGTFAFNLTSNNGFALQEGDKVVFDKVLMANGVVGNPYVSSKVEGVVLKQGKQKKLTIFRYKPNKRSTRVKKGHRQPYTKVEIKKIK